ncbi:SoxS protein [Paracoccus sp. CPCC 101403]|uniref:SoxS protein n=1 Tax=Paracoccus broussonetiae TaxID=3075834 RepID=A0ABU3EH19_9RHOB|nr:SoxS protein [Paracoccus sp. CPCC 101403]MDT1063542.1 SoxS protein [Paracoccus sp. CPCC 101403]
MKPDPSKPSRRSIIGLALGASLVARQALAGQADLRLLMVRRKGCVYCAQWDKEIAPVYARHPEGRAAPLLMVDVDGPFPDGLALARMPWLTPGFILLLGGQEVTRFEGYPGADKFFPVLHDMIAEARRWG